MSGSAGPTADRFGTNFAALAIVPSRSRRRAGLFAQARPHFLLKNSSGLALGGGHAQYFGQHPVAVLFGKIDGGVAVVAGSGWVGAA